MENLPTIFKSLSDGILENLRPLYNSNMTKYLLFSGVKIVFFLDGNPFFGLIYDFKITLKMAIFQNLGMPEMATKIQLWDHLTIDSFATLLL